MITTTPDNIKVDNDKERIDLSCCCQSSKPSSRKAQSVKPKTFSEMIWRFALGLVLTGQSMIFGLAINSTPPPYGTPIYWTLHGGLILATLIVLLLLGGGLFRETAYMLSEQRLSIEGLFTLSALGAFVGSLFSTLTGKGSVYYEVVAVVLFIYTVGKMLGARSRAKAVEEVGKLRKSFDVACIQSCCGERKQVLVAELSLSDIVSIGPGDAIPVDGTIIAGQGFVKETAMSGELEPITRSPGDALLAGSYSIDGTFTLRPTALKGQRKLDALLETIETATLSPSNLQEQANRLVKWFLPIVFLVSLTTFITWTMKATWVEGLLNSMSVLLVACPCALGLATPLAVWTGLWRLSEFGLVSRSGVFIDKLAQITHVVLDKTGTLTEETLSVSQCMLLDDSKINLESLRSLIKTIEGPVKHPVAQALKQWAGSGKTDAFELITSNIIPGMGIEAQLKDRQSGVSFHVLIGEQSLMPKNTKKAFSKASTEAKKKVYLIVDDQPVAVFLLEESYRKSTEEALSELQQLGLKATILTGDSHFRFSKLHGVDIQYGLSPEQKNSYIQKLKNLGDAVLFVGDGINDAPAMMSSDASIAMEGGADLTRSSAMAILMGSELRLIGKSIRLCRKIRQTVYSSIIYAAGYNSIGMFLAALGWLHPVAAILIMFISSAFVTSRAIHAIHSIN